MRKLTAFAFKSDSESRDAKYDWNRLLDGCMWKVSADEAYPRGDEPPRTTIERFRRTAHAAANVRDMKLQTQIIDDSHLVIQARPVE